MNEGGKVPKKSFYPKSGHPMPWIQFQGLNSRLLDGQTPLVSTPLPPGLPGKNVPLYCR